MFHHEPGEGVFDSDASKGNQDEGTEVNKPGPNGRQVLLSRLATKARKCMTSRLLIERDQEQLRNNEEREKANIVTARGRLITDTKWPKIKVVDVSVRASRILPRANSKYFNVIGYLFAEKSF